MSANLTPLQQNLIDGLIKEFTKINPKPSSDKKRFSFETITECNNEEKRFFLTIEKHNLLMIKSLVNQFNIEIKEFKKEFGKIIDIQMGYVSSTPIHTFETWISSNTKTPTNNNEWEELYLFLVSKKKYDSSDNHCNNKLNFRLFVDFKREAVYHTLPSGKEIVGYKINGLLYSTHVYHERRSSKYNMTTSTLDEMIQNNKNLQTAIVKMAS